MKRPPSHSVSTERSTVPASGPALKGTLKSASPPCARSTKNSFLPVKERGPSMEIFTETRVFSSAPEKSFRGAENVSPGETARGSESSVVTSRAIRTDASPLPNALPAEATAMRRPLPLNSGTSKVASNEPSSPVGTLPKKIESIRKVRAETGDIPARSAAMASSPAPPPALSSGVSLDSNGRSWS